MPHRPSRHLFLVVAVLAAIGVALLGAASLYRNVGSFQQLGFEPEAAGGTWAVAAVSAESTGLLEGDQIVLVNGSEAPTREALVRALRERPQSELLIERAGIPAQVRYERPGLAIDWQYLLLAVIGIGYLFIGFYTLLRDRERAGRLFYLWCLVSGLVYVASAQPPFDTVGKWIYISEELGRILLAPLTLHLFLIFPRPLPSLEKRLGWIPFLYLPAAFLLLAQADLILLGGRVLSGGNVAGGTRLLDQLVLFQLAGFALASAAVLFTRLRRGRDSEPLRQSIWIAIGLLAGYLPFVTLYLVPRSLDLQWPPYLTTAAVAPLALVPLTFAYSILRYKLWDIGIVVRDTLSLATTILIGVLGFSLVNLAVDRAVPETVELGRTLLSFTSGLMIAGLMIPTRRRIGASLERLQYGGAFRRRRGLVEFGREMLEERDLERLSSALLGELTATFDLARANLYLGTSERLSAQRHETGVPEELSREVFDDAFWGSDVRSLSGVSLSSEAAPTLELYSAGYRYAFPLTSRQRPIGLLVVGYKRGENALSSDDIDLVRNLLNQVSLAIDNARLLGRVQEQLAVVSNLQETTEEILESSPAGIALVDGHGTVERANAALANLLGEEPSELTGRSLAALLGETGLPRPDDGLRELRWTDAEGGEHYLQVSVAPVATDRQGASVVMVNDVTRRVAIENALKEQERLASLGMLAAGVAHEVNTPITGISSYAQMLLANTPEDDPRRDLLQKVERQTFRASRIVNNLLEFSRDRPRKPRPVSLNFIVEECLDLLKERIRENEVEVAFTAPETEITVSGNDGELLQVFTNLVVNATDAMKDGGRLAVSFDLSHPEKVIVAVADTGGGIPADKLDQIFQPFFSTKLHEGGTGLGLSISYNIVQRHGGSLRVSSAPGEGSTFFVELPTQQETLTAGD